MKPTIRDLVFILRKEARRRTGEPWFIDLQAARCDQADLEHEESDRQYMHVGHRFGRICYAAAADQLDLPWKLGLVIHEIGHLTIGGPAMASGVKHSEGEANEIGRIVTGIRVVFKGDKILEYASPPKWLKEMLQ